MFTVFFFKIEQWKAESNNSERQRQRMEAAYMNLQVQKWKKDVVTELQLLEKETFFL